MPSPQNPLFMNIYIHTSALETGPDSMLHGGALYGIMHLIQSGIGISFDETALNQSHLDLIHNEGIRSVGFEPSEADGTIRKEEQYLFETNDCVTERSDNWPGLVQAVLFPSRTATINRKTKETDISLSLNLDGTGKSSIDTGLSFFDHMLEQIARHGLIDLDLICKGDLEVDEHHTIEDTSIVFGQAIRQAVSGNKAGIQRYGFVLPMDEARATVSIDLSDRPFLRWEVKLKREYVGDFPTEMLEHFFYTMAMNAKATLHVSADGKNEHHMIESVFKGFARALRFAISRN